MNIQRPNWYTIDQLAELWNVQRDMINYYIETRQLRASARYIHDDDMEDKWTASIMDKEAYADDCTTLSHNGYQYAGQFIRLEVVERFEKTHQENPGPEDITSTKTDTERQAEIYAVLREEGLDNKQIAKKLKHAFPTISNHRLGKLITIDSMGPASPGALKKRGARLLK